MTVAPIITVVMPVYNRRDVVGRTLDSFAAQSCHGVKFVLVDNNSTDGTADVLRAWAEAHSTDVFDVTLITETRPGAAAARNAGLDLVDTPWVMFFDSDDVMLPGHLQGIVDTILTGKADLIGWDVRVRFLSGRSAVKRFRTDHALYNCIQHGTMASQRYACLTDIVRRAGGWRRDLSTWDDIELGTRILANTPSLRIVRRTGAPTVDIYESEESISGLTFHSRAAESEHALDVMSADLRPKYRYMVNLKRIVLAACYKREGYAADAARLRREALTASDGLWHRLLFRVAYAYTAAGHRGAATLLRLLL